MSIHLQREIEEVKRSFLSLSALVEDNLTIAAQALVSGTNEQHDRLEVLDLAVDRKEVELEEECLKLLALHQPVAVDLRFIVAVLKTNNDLERVGDLAVSLYHKAIKLESLGTRELPFDLEGMAGRSREMLHRGVQAFVELDLEAAEQVCAADNEVDEMKRHMRRQAEAMMRDRSEEFNFIYTLLGASRNLERIADHATNIAEDVIYMINGRIVRHQAEED